MHAQRRVLRGTDIPILLCYGFISLTGCFGNSITVMVIARNRTLHTLYNFLLLNLAVADLIACTFSLVKLSIVISAYKSGITDLSAELLCRFFTTVIYCSIMLSILSLAAISFERYFGIVKPIFHRNMTSKRLRYILLFAWFVSTSSGALLSQELRMDETTFYCFASSQEEDWPKWKITGGSIMIIITYFIPQLMIVVLYGKIVRHMWTRRRTQNIALSENAQSEKLSAQKARRTVRSLIFITALFEVALLPEFVYFAMILYDRKYIDATLFYKIGIPTVAITAINPFIYTLSHSALRKAAKQLFSRNRQVAPLITRSTGRGTQ